jgi:hypothetical protein
MKIVVFWNLTPFNIVNFSNISEELVVSVFGV